MKSHYDHYHNFSITSTCINFYSTSQDTNKDFIHSAQPFIFHNNQVLAYILLTECIYKFSLVCFIQIISNLDVMSHVLILEVRINK